MKAVLGIGNPGKSYAQTRHNIGFMVADALAERAGESFRSRFESHVADARLAQERVLLIKPQTYVNESGRALRQALDWHGLDRQDILIVVDDFNLDLGALRARRGGSSGGHRGLESIARHLGTTEFARLRVGIGSPGHRDGRDFVLDTFDVSERDAVRDAVVRAADAAVTWVRDGIEACMNAFNSRPAQPSSDDEKEDNA